MHLTNSFFGHRKCMGLCNKRYYVTILENSRGNLKINVTNLFFLGYKKYIMLQENQCNNSRIR